MRSGQSSWSSFSFGGVISTSCCHFSIIRSGQSSWFPFSSRLVFCFVGVCVISLKTLSTFVKLVLYDPFTGVKKEYGLLSAVSNLYYLPQTF